MLRKYDGCSKGRFIEIHVNGLTLTVNLVFVYKDATGL